jgi:hypothetical protein
MAELKTPGSIVRSLLANLISMGLLYKNHPDFDANGDGNCWASSAANAGEKKFGIATCGYGAAAWNEAANCETCERSHILRARSTSPRQRGVPTRQSSKGPAFPFPFLPPQRRPRQKARGGKDGGDAPTIFPQLVNVYYRTSVVNLVIM